MEEYDSTNGTNTDKDTIVENYNKNSGINFDKDYSNVISYILSEETGYVSDWQTHNKQKALWYSVLNRAVDNFRNKDSSTLYSKAERYDNYINNLNGKDLRDTIKLGYNTLTQESKQEYIYVGPYYISYGDGEHTEFAKITNAYLTGKRKNDTSFRTSAGTEWILVDKDKKTFSSGYPKGDGTAFYIRVSKNSNIKEISKLEFNIQGITAEAEYTTMRNIYVVFQPWTLHIEGHENDRYNKMLFDTGEEYIELRAKHEGFADITKAVGGEAERYDSNGNRIYLKDGWGNILADKVTIGNGKIRVVNQQDILMLKWAKRITTNYSAEVEFDIKFTMDLSGKVWLDEPSSGKDPSAANGKMASTEKKVQGVKVYLCDSNGTVITDTDIVAKNPVTTNSSGYYEFKEIPIGDYKIKFEYNGMKYIATKTGGDSKATEIGRTTYNEKFNTIKVNKAYKSDGTSTTSLNYTINADKTPQTSTLKTGTTATTSGSTYKISINKSTEYEYDKFKITSSTSTYSDTTTDINFGIVIRDEGDLTLRTDVYSAELSVNGKSVTYNYNQSAGKIFGVVLSNPTWKASVTYNLAILDSDYRYRVMDYSKYATDVERKFKTNYEEVYGVNGSKIQESTYAKEAEIFEELSKGGELKTKVTYKLIVYNQSDVVTGKVNEIKDYYSIKYDKNPSEVTYSLKNTSGEETEKGDLTEKWEHKTTETNYHTATLTGMPTIPKGQYLEIYVTFVLADKNLTGTTEIKNVAQITSYSLGNGLIDKDSAPGNLTGRIKGPYEDDEDNGPGFKITISNDKRVVSGYVWNDTSKTDGELGNGTKDSGETGINNVTVQLIEIKQKETTVNNTKYTVNYEYIWQEMKSGSDKKAYIKNDGTGVVSDASIETTKQNGLYYFNNIIPGNYIVRFIYGDGSTEDMKIYNGQDYESTKNTQYKNEFLDLGYIANVSKASDSEARRLEVINYSKNIDNELGVKLNELTNKTAEQAVYDNTYMYAETPKINMCIEKRNDASNGSTQRVSSNDPGYDLTNIHFGLEERQKNDIQLTKEVKSVKLTLADGQVIVDTENGLTQNVNNVKPSDPKKYRGTISLYLDEGIMHGATLEITYKYTVENKGETDYITEKLDLDKTINLTDNAKNLRRLEKLNSYKVGEYLGTSYYLNDNSTGNKVATKATIVEYVPSNIIMVDGDVNKNWNKVTRELTTKEKENYSAIVTRETKEIEPGKVDKFELTVSKVLSPNSETLSYLSNTAEVIKYTNSVGRRDCDSIPESHASMSEPGENPKTAPVEDDEAWAQTVTILPPFGGNMNNTMYYILGTIAVLALAGGIILIKKLVLKNK